MTPQEIFAWEVSVKGMPWTDTVNARTRGEAKSEKWCSVRDAWRDIPFTAMRARKIGPVHTSEQFKYTAINRGMPGLICGVRVKVGTATGTIIGHNSSANFEVLFDADGGRYAGRRLPVHPDDIEVLE